jgi:hypothetical protein
MQITTLTIPDSLLDLWNGEGIYYSEVVDLEMLDLTRSRVHDQQSKINCKWDGQWWFI